MAPDARLTVDHVIPEALGGQDIPENLVTACADCNSGKAATGPGEHIVADVSQDALRWRAAMLEATAAGMQEIERREAFRYEFYDEWRRWTWADYADGKEVRRNFDLPKNWGIAIEQFYGHGITTRDLERAIEAAMTAYRVKDQFAYCLGILKTTQRTRMEVAHALIAEREAAGGPNPLP